MGQYFEKKAEKFLPAANNHRQEHDITSTWRLDNVCGLAAYLR